MTRRLHVDALRHADPVTLEIQVQEPLRRPVVQLSPETLVDMLALSEVEGLPRALRRSLLAFADRTANEAHDLPAGEAWAAFLAEIEQLEAARVPHTLRRILAQEAERRGGVEGGRTEALLQRLSEVEPAPAAPGVGAPRIQRMGTAPAPARKAERTARGQGREPAARRPAPARAPKAVDLDRRRWIEEVCLARLSDYLDQGLKEDVLVAGIRHRGRNTYPDLTVPEITGVLRALQDDKRVRYSAGRWKRVGW